jgi:acetyl esterase/lipase
VYGGETLKKIMIVKFIIPAFLLLFIAENIQAQLISWRDLIGDDLPQPTERIYYGDDRLHFGDLWLPDVEPHTTVILYHGGCWLDMYPGVEIMNHMAEALRQDGFAVWNVEYRRLGHEGGGYPGTFLDAGAGADHFRKIADQHNLDPGRVIVSGHSAGGHLATWIANRKHIPDTSPLFQDDPIPVHAVISLAGINDLERYANYGSSSCGSGTVESLVDLEERGENAYLDTSPVNLLPLGIPFVEITAAFDAPVPPFFGYHFLNAALEAGDDARFILQPDAGHFEMIAPWSEEWIKVLDVFRNSLSSY